MAGTKFQYDESGATFYYFVLTFLALVIIPVTFFYWPRVEVSGDADPKKRKRCHCEPCIMKQNFMQSKEPSKKIRQRFM